MKKKQIIEELQSKDTLTALNALSNLRKQGNPKDIGDIIDTLHSNKNPELRESISAFLCDLKDQKSVTHIAAALQNKKYKEEYGIIASSCWQSGLDYSAFPDIFTELVINESYIVAIEAFTVIESMTGNLSNEDIDKNTKKIKKAIDVTNKEKSYLYIELVKILESWKS